MITMDKKYMTRDGRPVRVICTDREGNDPYLPVVYLVLGEDGREVVCLADADGRWGVHCEGRYDLIEVKEEGQFDD